MCLSLGVKGKLVDIEDTCVLGNVMGIGSELNLKKSTIKSRPSVI